MNGWQVIKRLQREPALLKDNKEVLMSAGWRLDGVGNVLSSEIIIASLRQPVDLEELLSLVRYLEGDVGC